MSVRPIGNFIDAAAIGKDPLETPMEALERQNAILKEDNAYLRKKVSSLSKQIEELERQIAEKDSQVELLKKLYEQDKEIVLYKNGDSFSLADDAKEDDKLFELSDGD